MYKPSQRHVSVEMLASAGWVTGTIHVPERSALLAFLNKRSEFMPMTEVTGGNAGEFLAMRRQAVVLLLPDAHDMDEHPWLQPGSFEPCRVRCLFPTMSVEGTIQVLGGQRMSDFLESNPSFFQLSDCTLASEDGHAQSGIPHVIVNAGHLLAVADLTGREHGHITSLLAVAGGAR